MHHAAALGAVPLELLQSALLAGALEDQADGAGLGALRGVREVAGEHPHLPLADIHARRAIRGHHVDVHVAAHLIENLLVGVDVEVSALVGTPHHHDDEVLVTGEHLFIGHRWLQAWTVLIDPGIEVEGLGHIGHGYSLPVRRWATAWISMSRCGCGNSRTATVVRVGPVWSKYSAYTWL